MVFTAWLKINSHSQIFRYGQSIFYLPHRPKFLDFFDLCLNWVSIYSWSIGHILEHEFFCLGCLGWAGSKEKKVDLSFSGQLLRVFFPTFWGQKKRIFFENIVESFHIFLIFLMILFTAEPLRFFIYISVCCWTFELSLLLNLWDYLLLLNLWDYALDYVSVYCWTFGFFLLLNIWDYALDYVSVWCWSFENVQQ